MSKVVEHTTIWQKGYSWRLTYKRTSLSEADKYGQRRVTGELEQEVGGNTETLGEMWDEMRDAKKQLEVK